MSKYKFIDLKTDKLVELELSFEKIMSIDVTGCLKVRGRWYKRYVEEAPKKARKERIGNKAYNKDLVSRTAGVHSSQAAEFNEAARKGGITGVYYSPENGNAHFESKSASRKEMKRRGLHDQDGSYGDG